MSLNPQALEKAIEFEMQYGPRCRDCANAGGICPASGLPCGGRRKAVAYVLKAYAYGLEHGFIAPILSALSADIEVVHRAKAYLASQTRDKTLHPSHPDVIINDLVQAVEARPEDAGEVVAYRYQWLRGDGTPSDGGRWSFSIYDMPTTEPPTVHCEALVTQASYLALSAKVRALDGRHTVCAQCLVDKATPLRIERLGGYICLACVEAALAAAEQSKARLAEFVRWAIRSVDSEDVNDRALRDGLIACVPYDPAVHGVQEFVEPGDDRYVFAGPLAEAKP